MAHKNCSFLVIFLTFNILFFTLVSAHGNYSTHHKSTPTPHKHTPTPHKSIPKKTPSKPIHAPPKPPHPKPFHRTCPRDVIKLGDCTSILGWINYSIGVPSTHCCTFLSGLIDFDFAICMCTALRANIMGVVVNIPIAFTQLINFCARQIPDDFECLPDVNSLHP
jgi:hypothetical protein